MNYPNPYLGADELVNNFTTQEFGAVDSLDPMQPVPRAGKFFAELVVREEMQSAAGVVLLAPDKEDEELSSRPKRAVVLQLGPASEDEPWDFEPGWHVIVPYHAGHHFIWYSQPGIEESLWIIDTNEVIAVFQPR